MADGYLEQWSGSLRDAEARWPGAVAVMKLAVIIAAGKSPRLVADATAPGVNARCRIPERIELPTIRDVMRALAIHYALHPDEELAAVVIDVKAAHKQVKIREADGGLGFCRLGKKLFRYRTCSFGAKFSSYWWARVAGALTRILHAFVHFRHYCFIYVDDLLLLGPRDRIWEVAELALALLSAIGCPISWQKLRVGSVVPYLGFLLDVAMATVGVDEEKVARVLAFLRQLQPRQRLCSGVFEKGLGLLMWASWAVPSLRPWLASLYHDLTSPGAHFCLVDKVLLNDVFASLTGDGSLRREVTGVDARAGWKLCAVGKRPAHSRADALGCISARLPGKVWLRFSDRSGAQVRVSGLTALAASLWRGAMKDHARLQRCLVLNDLGGAAAADAWACSSTAGLGGWFLLEDGTGLSDVYWFRLEIAVSDLPQWFRLSRNMQADIAFYELLAQVILAVLRLRFAGPVATHVQLKQVCDNSPSVGAIGRSFTTKVPLCYALQALAFHAARLDSAVQVSHIAGKKNGLADRISRFRKFPNTLNLLNADREVVVDLNELLDPVWG